MRSSLGREPNAAGLRGRSVLPSRLARTASRARWPEYRALLERALARGYRVVALEAFLADPALRAEQRVLVLRHDVDQDPRSAVRMAAEEERLGLRSTWYLRWRTAHPRLVRVLRRGGHDVGLHYETLTRRLLAEGAPVAPERVAELVEPCRATLVAELEAFAGRFGPAVSCAAHGDTRVRGVDNTTLVGRRDLARFGVDFEANRSLRARDIDLWVTDRSPVAGGWGDGHDPFSLLDAGRGPILLLTHPNNWCSGASIWRDRLLRHALPAFGSTTGRSGVLRSGSDVPPL